MLLLITGSTDSMIELPQVSKRHPFSKCRDVRKDVFEKMTIKHYVMDVIY